MIRETPAGYSRNLHLEVKRMRSELKALGYPDKTIFVVMMDVILRLAKEEGGEDGMSALLEQLRMGA